MSNPSEEKFKLASLLADISNHLKDITPSIDEFIKNLGPPEVCETPQTVKAGTISHITDKVGRTLGRIVERQDEAVILPLETLQIKVSDPAVQNFLIPKILQPIKEKHGADYTIGEAKGLLKEIRLRGGAVHDELEELRSPLVWTLMKASTWGKRP